MKIIRVKYELGDYFEGCETCDYGSSYYTNLEIFTDKCILKFECNTMYDYLNESDLMKLLSVEYYDEWALINAFKEQLDLEGLEVKIIFNIN